VFLFVFIRVDRMAVAHRALAVAMFGVTFVSMFMNTTLIQSFARYMAVVWPFSWIIASRRGRTFELIGLAGFSALFVVFAILHFTQALAP
jgi:hypothetical protein